MSGTKIIEGLKQALGDIRSEALHTRRIVTQYDRLLPWSAQREGAGEDDPVGYGHSEAEAVEDLIEQEGRQ